MIKIFNTPLLPLLCLVMSIGMIASCEKKDNMSSGKVELLSFGPTGAKHGDTLRFIGNNLDKVTAIDLTGASVPQSAFIQQTSEVILIIVPQETVQGSVMLKTPEGDVVSKTALNLDVPVTITSMPAEVRPGENITINGTYLNWVTRVTFGKDKVVDSFVSKSLNQLVVTVPMDAQTGELIISTGGTEPLEIVTDSTLVVTLPAITALSPNPVKHASNLTMTGSNLDLVKTVLFTGDTTKITTFVSQSPTQIVVKVPAKAKQGKITLVAPSEVTVESGDELKLVLPVATLFTPNPVDRESNLTITGTDLDLVTGVTFAGLTAPVTTFVSQSATKIVIKVPAGSAKGKLTFSVANTPLTVESSEELKFNGDPTITPFKLVVYDEALNAAWEKWGGWGTDVQELENTEHASSGSKAIKITWKDAYGGFQLHPKTSFPLPNGYTTIRLSLYGGAGTVAGSKIALYIKDAAGKESTKKELILAAGAYTTYEISLSDLGNPTDIAELNLQNFGTANITVYVDDYGFF